MTVDTAIRIVLHSAEVVHFTHTTQSRLVATSGRWHGTPFGIPAGRLWRGLSLDHTYCAKPTRFQHGSNRSSQSEPPFVPRILLARQLSHLRYGDDDNKGELTNQPSQCPYSMWLYCYHNLQIQDLLGLMRHGRLIAPFNLWRAANHSFNPWFSCRPRQYSDGKFHPE